MPATSKISDLTAASVPVTLAALDVNPETGLTRTGHSVPGGRSDRFNGERFTVVGATGGGPYALACAARIPERVGRVALVCAIGPLAGMRSIRYMVAMNRAMFALASGSPLLARLAVGLAAQYLMKKMRARLSALPGRRCGDHEIREADDFRYTALVDHSVLREQRPP